MNKKDQDVESRQPKQEVLSRLKELVLSQKSEFCVNHIVKAFFGLSSDESVKNIYVRKIDRKDWNRITNYTHEAIKSLNDDGMIKKTREDPVYPLPTKMYEVVR